MQEEHITNEIVEWSGDEWGDKGGGATSESSLIEIVFQLRYLGPRAPSLTVVRGCPAPKRFVWKFFERGPFVSLVFSTRLVIPRQYCHEIATGIGANSTSSECRAEHAEITPMPTKGSRAGVFDCMCSDTVLNLIGICRKNIPMMTQIGFFYSFRFWFVEIPKISMLIMVRMLVKGAWNRHKTCMHGPVKPCVEPLGLLNPNSKHGKSKCKHDIPSTVFQKFWQCKGMGDMGTFASSNRADDEWLEAELWAAGMKRVAFNATSQHNLLSTFAHIALSQLLKSLDSQHYTVRLPCHPLQSPFCCYGDSMISIFLLYMVYGMLILHSSTLFSWACQKQASLKDKSCSTGFHRCTVWPSFIFQASCIFKQPLSILPVFVPVSSCLGLLDRKSVV